jgi:hypothetical protein
MPPVEEEETVEVGEVLENVGRFPKEGKGKDDGANAFLEMDEVLRVQLQEFRKPVEFPKEGH